MTKTNAMRLLDAAGIEYDTLEYEVDESDLSGVSIARKTGQDYDAVFKTLVFSGEKNGFGVCCIPVREELDLKKVAKAFGEKKVEMIHVKDLLGIFVSGGMRGLMLGVSPAELAGYVDAKFEDVCI